jgi:4-amino-4-deoxy-L-arabinose transferase-like glycosyltransferase
MADLWSRGNFSLEWDPGVFIYKPAIYFIDSIALNIFGRNDYSISLTNGVFAIINILLIFYLSYLITKNYWIGTLSCLMYAFFPGPIYYSRVALVHTPSITFLLISLLFFTKFLIYRAISLLQLYFYICISGLSLSIGANIHPSLALFAPGYVVLIIIQFFKKNKELPTNILNLIKTLLYFCISFMSLFFTFGLYYGFNKVISALIYQGTWKNNYINPIAKFKSIIFDSVIHESNILIPILFILCIYYFLIYKKNKFDAF